MFSLRNKKNIMRIPPLICSYDFREKTQITKKNTKKKRENTRGSFAAFVMSTLSFKADLDIYCSNTHLCCIALIKALFSIQKYRYFSYFSTKTYVVGTH